MSEETTNQVNTEATNLALVEEAVLGALTPPTSGWANVQPNSYGDFGSQYKKTPRRPISKNAQYRKGMLTGEDSGLSIEVDLTKDVLDLFGEAMFRCAVKHSGGKGQSLQRPTAVTATGYTVPSAGDLQQRTLVVARNFDTAANNGLKLVGAGSTTLETKTSGLVAESPVPATAELEVAGFRGATSDIRLDTAGNLISTVADFTTMGLNVEQWIVVGGRDDDSGIYSFATAEFRGAAMITKIEANKLTLTHRTWLVQQRSYLDLGTVCTGNIDTIVEAIEAGPAGDAITIAIVADSGTAAGSISEAGNAVTIHVKTSATATTVTQFEALVNQSTKIRVKTADATGSDPVLAGDVISATPLDHGDEGPDAGTGKTIEIYFTRWYRNLPIDHTDYRKPSFAGEVTYPELDTGTEYEYLLGNVLGEATFNFPTEGKVTVNLTFVGTRTLDPTTSRKTGPSTARDYAANEGVSTATDLQRLRVVNVDDVGISTDFESLKIMINNNVAPQKQLAKLGAKRHNHGEHMASAEAVAIFTDTAVIKAVRTNGDHSLDILSRNADFGCLYHLQKMTIDSAGRKLEKNKGVTITAKTTGFQNKLSTDSLSVFAYLPPLAESAL